MKLLLAFFCSAFAYAATALILFGNVLQPIAYVTFWSDRLGAPFWPFLVFFGGFLGLSVSAFFSRLNFEAHITLPVFIVLAMSLSSVFVGSYASVLRARSINVFDADAEFRNSFFQTLRNAPREFQFYLHAAALKDCVPYAWSYRTMSFYQLPNNIAVNVLPHEWVVQCGITRD
ncbi:MULTISPECIES: hypothetical protein [unclassified Ruegeria]|uniref:hypothetical protein n=1 Tax=unclassified Ruegeria TaxID=2625375 RepID=UPI00148989CC|nr:MULTISPECIES: hypothetical protein [unclassified Ruegeria]